VPLLVGTTAAACCIAAAAILGSGLLSGGSLSAASAPATSNGWQHVVSQPLAFGGVLAASQTQHLPTGPPGNPSPRATVKLVQADTGTPNSLGQELKSWKTQAAPAGTPALNAVDSVDRTHVWAVGANCTILFSANMKTWTEDTAVTGCTPGTSLNGVSVTSPAGPGWAVGSNGTILVCPSACNTAKAAWSALRPGSVKGMNDGSLTNASPVAQSNSLFATTAYVGWAISDPTPGANKIPAATTISSVNTTTKTATMNHTATGPATKDPFKVTAPASVLPPSSFTFTSVWAADSTHVYAVGDGKIWACSAACSATGVGGAGNAAWAPLTPAGLSGGNTLTSVAGNGAHLTVAVGSGGTILLCTANCATSGAGWAALTGSPVPGAGTNFTGVYATGPTGIYAVGNGAIWACSAACNQPVSGSGAGKATWTNLVPSYALPNLLAVAASSDGPAWAVGQAGALWYCNAKCAESGTSWVPIVSPTADTLRGVAVADPSHAWAVGDNGTTVAQINPTDTQNRIANGTGWLGQALTPSVWIDDYHVSLRLLHHARGAFDSTRLAVGQLIGIKRPPPAWAVTDMTWLDYAMRLLATTAINENSHCPHKPRELTAAQDELAAGDKAYSSGHYDTAIVHYKNARVHAVNANGHSCPVGGITVTPTGAPAFSLLHLVPGDSSATGTITVTTTHAFSPLVVLYEQNVVDGGLLSGTYPLQLKIVEDGWHTLYNGPLASGWTGSGTSYLTLPGSSGNRWGVNEAHTFVFTVSWSQLAGNTYENETASLNFVWARS